MKRSKMMPSCRYKNVSQAARAVRWHEYLYAYEEDGMCGYFSPYSYQPDNTGRRIQRGFKALRWVTYGIVIALGIGLAYVTQVETWWHIALLALAILVACFVIRYGTRHHEAMLVESHMVVGVRVPRYTEESLIQGIVTDETMFGLTGYAWALWESAMLRDTCREKSPDYESVQRRICKIEEAMCPSSSMETP